MKPAQIKWHPPSVAEKWPEGSTVLISRPERARYDNGHFSIHSYFRPDWINKGEYQHGDKTLFALLELPK